MCNRCNTDALLSIQVHVLGEHPKWIKDARGSMLFLTLTMDALGASQMVIGFNANGALFKPQSAQGAYSVKHNMQG